MLKNKFYLKANKYLAIFFMLFIVSSCSSLSSLKFWGSDEIDPDEPKVKKGYSNAKILMLIGTDLFQAITYWEILFLPLVQKAFFLLM